MIFIEFKIPKAYLKEVNSPKERTICINPEHIAYIKTDIFIESCPITTIHMDNGAFYNVGMTPEEIFEKIKQASE